MSEIFESYGPLPKSTIYEVASGQTIAKGDQVAENAAGLVVSATDATAVYVVGIALDAGVAGESIQVEHGIFEMLNSSGNALAASHRRSLVFAEDAETVSTDDSLVPSGLFVGFNAAGRPLVLLSPLTAAIHGRSGVATLVAGTVDVDTTIQLKANSRILLTAGDLSGGTNFSYVCVAARTDGAPGTATFTIEARDASHALDADCVGDVTWFILD